MIQQCTNAGGSNNILFYCVKKAAAGGQNRWPMAKRLFSTTKILFEQRTTSLSLICRVCRHQQKSSGLLTSATQIPFKLPQQCYYSSTPNYAEKTSRNFENVDFSTKKFYYNDRKRRPYRSLKTVIIGGLGAGSLYCSFFYHNDHDSAESESSPKRNDSPWFPWFFKTAYSLESSKPGSDGTFSPPLRPDLPTYRRPDVNKRKSASEGDGRIWVTYKQGVYDITEFIEAHPGGAEKINLAAGGSVDPFWKIYAQHHSEMVMQILEGLRVGNLDARDVVEQKPELAADDPYRFDPVRHPALMINSQRPYNAETPPNLLVDNFNTPNDLFYVRNHMPVPEIKGSDHNVVVSGVGIPRERRLTVEYLKSSKFKPQTVSSVLQCAGNRRSAMHEERPVKGLNWKSTAIGNGEWKGAKLKDVLVDCGYKLDSIPAEEQGNYHVILEGRDQDPLQGNHYETSIPLHKALSDESIIAYEMNGADIPVDHGYPLRAIIPGYVAARQVKWLRRIMVSRTESTSHWQQKDYRVFSPSATPDTVDYSSVPAIQDAPVQSAIMIPSPGSKVYRGTEVALKGYAWSGGGRGIIRVDVSADGGRTWHTAELQRHPQQPLHRMWAWTLWSVSIPIPENLKDGSKMVLMCKAVDSSYNVQPEGADGIWNFRGLLNNCWHRIHVTVLASDE